MPVLNNANIPWPDFANLQVIDPDKFDANYAELQTKFNEVVTYLNTMQEAGLPASAIVPKAITEAQIKDFVLNDAIVTAYTNTSDVNTILSFLVKRIKEITGETTWSTAVDDTLSGLALKIANLVNVDMLKAPINNPTFTGVVNGITPAMVGLGNVNNTSDVDKPISTAVQSELNKRLATDNITPFTPTTSYHPATKDYVDATVAGAVLGNISDNSIDDQKMAVGNKKQDIANLAISQLQLSIFDFDNQMVKNNWIRITKFNYPSVGYITEEFTKSGLTQATRVTRFDYPLAGNITEIITYGGKTNTKVTVFDSPSVGDITETITEV